MQIIDSIKEAIEKLETATDPDDLGIRVLQVIAALRDSVKQAEEQEAVGFEEWAQSNVLICDLEEPEEVFACASAWTAGQQAAIKVERNRIKKIVEDLQHESYDGNECFHCCQAILELIDE